MPIDFLLPGAPKTEQNRDRLLTPREVEIIGIAITGATDKEIGKELGISDETVKRHLFSIRNKLGADNRTHLAYVWAGGGEAGVLRAQVAARDSTILELRAELDGCKRRMHAQQAQLRKLIGEVG